MCALRESTQGEVRKRIIDGRNSHEAAGHGMLSTSDQPLTGEGPLFAFKLDVATNY